MEQSACWTRKVFLRLVLLLLLVLGLPDAERCSGCLYVEDTGLI